MLGFIRRHSNVSELCGCVLFNQIPNYLIPYPTKTNEQ